MGFRRPAPFFVLLLAGCSVVIDRRTDDDPRDETAEPIPDDPATVDPGEDSPGCDRAPIVIGGDLDVADVHVAEDCGALVSGSFGATVDFGGTPIDAQPGGRDAFVARFDERGAARWVLTLGTGNAGMDRVFDAVPDEAGGAYFTALYRREDAHGLDYTHVAGAVDANGALRWTTELLGAAVIAGPHDGVVRAVVEGEHGAEVLSLDAKSGTVLGRVPLVSGAGSILGIAEQVGRFVALVWVGGTATIGGTVVDDPGEALATVIVEPDGTMRLGSTTRTPGLQIWHTRVGAGPAGDFAAVFAFAGPLDVGDDVVVSPPLVDLQGLSTAIIAFDATGAARRTEAFLTTGSMRAIGVALDDAGTARAMIGISDDTLDVDGVHLDGHDAEARALVAVGEDGVRGASATRAEAMWGQPDGATFLLERDHATRRTRIVEAR